MNEHLRGNDMKIVDQRYNKKTGAARNAGLVFTTDCYSISCM